MPSHGVLVAFSDRLDGVSRPPFDSLNLAVRVGDRRDDVAENRRRVAAAAGFQVGALTLSRQAHGTTLRRVNPGDPEEPGTVADGLITASPGVVLGLLTADCAAVVLASPRGVAILHAGWRGLSRGIIGFGVAALGQVTNAWVGPAIRECCYEVGDEVVAAFRQQGLPAGRKRVDIPNAAQAALRDAGVAAIVASEVCTGCDPSFFSYRREGVTGRQGAFVSILGP